MDESLKTTLHYCLAYLAGQCDHATSRDDVGFNGRDTDTGHSLVAQLRAGHELSAKQWELAYTICQTYKNTQLRNINIPEFTIEQIRESFARQNRVLWKVELLTRGPWCCLRLVVEEGKKSPWDVFTTFKDYAKASGLRWSGELLGWWGPANLALRIRDAMPKLLGQVVLQDLGPWDQPLTEQPPAWTFPVLHHESPIVQHGGLRPYQREGISFLSQPGNWLLADDMGLGKTVQTILALPLEAPVLILAPCAARAVWTREVRLHCPRPCREVNKMKDFDWPRPGEIVVTNYEKLRLVNDAKLKTMPKHLILVADEIHLCKGTSKVGRVKQFRMLMRSMRYSGGKIIGLTGTPVLNRVRELFNLLTTMGVERIVFPGGMGRFNSYQEFRQLCGVREGAFGDEETGQIHPCVKEERLPRVMLRRTKEEVFPQMPRKQYESIEVSLPPALKRGMDEIWDKVKDQWGGRDLEQAQDLSRSIFGAIAFETISKMRHDLALVKMDRVLDWIIEMEEVDEPIVLVSSFVGPCDMAAKREGWAKITGDTSAAERGLIEDRFQSGHLRGVALTYKAGGVGITLSRSNRMGMVDLEWTPALVSQGEDRLRPHLQKRSCLYTLFEVQHPLEKRINELLRQKQALIEQVHN